MPSPSPIVGKAAGSPAILRLNTGASGVLKGKPRGQSSQGVSAQDQVTLNPVTDRKAIKSSLVPLSVTLEVPASAIGGLFKSLPVMMPKDRPEAAVPGSSVPSTRVLDAKVFMNPPQGTRPIAIQVERRPAEADDPQPLLVRENGIDREPRGWKAAVAAVPMKEQSNLNQVYVNLTLGIEEKDLQSLNGQEIVFAPLERIDQQSMTWKNGNGSFLYPTFVGASLVDEEPEPGSAPVMEYLLLDSSTAQADFPRAVEAAKKARPTPEKDVEVTWDGKPHRFQVQLTDRLRAGLKKEGYSFNPDRSSVTVRGAGGEESERDLSLSTVLRKERNEHFPPWTLYNEDSHTLAIPRKRVVVDLDPETRKTVLKYPDGVVIQGAVTPEIGKTYKGVVTGKNLRHDFDIRFTAPAAICFKNSGMTFSTQRAALYTAEGQLIPLDGRAPRLPEAGDENGLYQHDPAWTFTLCRRGENMIYGWPQHGVEIGVGADGKPTVTPLDEDGRTVEPGAVDHQGYTHFLRSHRQDRNQRFLKLLERDAGVPEPAQPSSLSEHRVNPETLIQAPNPDSARSVESLYNRILARRPAETGIDCKGLSEFLGRGFQEGRDFKEAILWLAPELSEEESWDKLARLAGLQRSGQSPVELLETLARKVHRSLPLEIVVVPRGEQSGHYLKPEEKKEPPDPEKLTARAYHPGPRLIDGNTLRSTRLYISEELVDTAERRGVVARELIQVFEKVRATDEERKVIDQAYAESMTGQREFSSTLGLLREEFLPTLSEEFFSLHGEDGPKWLKAHHGDIYQLFSDLTGADPAGGRKLIL